MRTTWNNVCSYCVSLLDKSGLTWVCSMKVLALLTLCVTLSLPSQAALIITGVFDGPLPGGDPKGVELFATTDITDLAQFALGVANNGGGSDGVETILPSQALSAGSFFFVATEDQDFAQWFGVAPGHVGGNGINHNGDDAIELFFDATGSFAGDEAVIDVFGDINTDVTGTAWDTVDGWAHRNDGVLANGGAFDANNWTFSGPNAWDGDDNFDGGSDNGTNLTATPPFPAGTFQIPEPTSTLLGAIGLGLVCFLRRKP